MQRLGWNGEASDQLVQHVPERCHGCKVVRGGIDTDDCIARAIQQAVEMPAAIPGVIGRVIGCRRTASRPGSPMVSRKGRGDVAFARCGDQVLIPHELADGSRHFRSDAGCGGGECFGVRVRSPAASRGIPDRQRGEGGEGMGSWLSTMSRVTLVAL